MPAKHYVKRYITETEYREWFDVNYSEYKFWEGIGITQERFDQIVLEIQSEPKRSEEHTSELQSLVNLVCRLLLEKKKTQKIQHNAFSMK